MKKYLFLLMLPLIICCVNNPEKATDSNEVSIDNSTSRDNSISETTFRPVSATMVDSEGPFSSTEFNCPNMTVYDKGNSVQLSWSGESIPLYEGESPDTYVTSQTKSGVTVRFVAYRSSRTRQIYLVICTTEGNGKRVDINFKP